MLAVPTGTQRWQLGWFPVSTCSDGLDPTGRYPSDSDLEPWKWVPRNLGKWVPETWGSARGPVFRSFGHHFQVEILRVSGFVDTHVIVDDHQLRASNSPRGGAAQVASVNDG